MKKQHTDILSWNWLFVLIFFIPSYTLQAQMQPIGIFDHHEDIGNPKQKGSAIYFG